MKRIAGLLLCFFICSSSFSLTLNDNGGISATQVLQVVHVKSESDILRAIQQANKQHIPIAIMGKQHSQGGQTLLKQAIELNMLSFNKILDLNIQKKQITVQTGITWGDIQKAINPYNLAIKSMQSPNIFTVGGSMSVNAHGDDFRSGSVGNNIIAFHILLASGKKVYVTPSTQPELWASVIGGYGLLGVVTDVTLQLTDNDLLLSNYQEKDLADFPSYFRENLLKQKDVALFYARLCIVPGPDFLRNLYVVTYKDTYQLPKTVVPLDNIDKWNTIFKPIFNVSRHGKIGKKLRWNMEKKVFREKFNHHLVTRNNAMQKPIKFAAEDHKGSHTDWLQEYFIPLDKLPQFVQMLREIILENKINVLNITIRSIPKEPYLLLSYANQRSFAVVIYFEQNLLEKDLKVTQSWTPKLIDSALSLGGNYYLPYQPYASKKQFQKAYPNEKRFLVIKRRFDPTELFNNRFYMNYLK